MPKVYRKGDKLVINLPDDIVGQMGLAEGDILEFMPHEGGRFVVSKKGKATATPTEEEMLVLKRLDGLRYNVRTKESVGKELSAQEARTLSVLLKKGYVSLQKSKKDGIERYSISDYIYDTYLMRKKLGGQAAQQQAPRQGAQAVAVPVAEQTKASPARQVQAREPKADAREIVALRNTGDYGDRLEKRGYIVVNNETEASGISIALEASIRQGYVLGVRAFNKKYYIALRSYIYANLPRILALISDKAMKVDDISSETGIESDGIRAILYVASENGDVTELKRDFFKIA